jgi:hypothetical protein
MLHNIFPHEYQMDANTINTYPVIMDVPVHIYIALFQTEFIFLIGLTPINQIFKHSFSFLTEKYKPNQ